MMLQQLNMFLVSFFLLILACSFPTKGLPIPSMDSPNPLLGDHFPDPFCVMEQTSFGIEKDQPAITVSAVKVDWKETPEGHVIVMDVPGLRKDKIKIEVVENSVLRVIGERKKEEKKGDLWHRAERAYGKFWRQFRLPENADLDSVKAKMENGVLTLTLRKLSHDKIKSTILVSIEEVNEKSSKLSNDGANK